jgi:hypothetical protein
MIDSRDISSLPRELELILKHLICIVNNAKERYPHRMDLQNSVRGLLASTHPKVFTKNKVAMKKTDLRILLTLNRHSLLKQKNTIYRCLSCAGYMNNEDIIDQYHKCKIYYCISKCLLRIEYRQKFRLAILCKLCNKTKLT